MSNYASVAAAKEIRGGHYRIGVTITPLDPSSYAPTNLTLRGPGSNVLAFTDTESWQYDSASETKWFEGVILELGDISAAAEIHSAFQTLPDPRLVLKNARINGMLDTSQYTFAAGSPAESPTATGDEVKLSQLLQFYILTGAVVEYKLYFFAGPDTVTTSTYVSDTIFKGEVSTIDITEETITLGLVQSTKGEDTLIPSDNHRIEDPPDPNAKDQFIPIVYGQFHHDTTYTVNGLTWYDAAIAGFKPALAPVLSWKRSPSSPDYFLVTNDCYGPNTDWGEQDEFTSGASSHSYDRLMVYFPEADAVGLIEDGTSAGQSKIYSDPTGFGGSTGITVIVQEYQSALVYVPCNAIYSDTNSLIDDPAALFSRDPFQYANLNCDDTTAGWAVDFTISPISIMGEIPLVTDCIGAYLVIGARSALSGSPVLRFGIRTVAGTDWVGGYAGTVYGQINGATLITAALNTQSAHNATAVPTSAYIQPSKAQQPIMRMDWRYVHDADPDVEGPMVVNVTVATAGAATDSIRLISCGVVCRVNLKTGGDILTRTSPVIDITGRIRR